MKPLFSGICPQNFSETHKYTKLQKNLTYVSNFASQSNSNGRNFRANKFDWTNLTEFHLTKKMI